MCYHNKLQLQLSKVKPDMGKQNGARSVRFEQLHLAALRQSKGVTLEQIADTTKISIRFLRAIEDEEFDKLPGGIFSTSYIRQYARAIDQEESELVEYYNLRMGVEPGAAPKNGRQTRVKGFRFPAALAGL